MPREPRNVREMAHALVKHVKLLRDYANKCFSEGDSAYAGEVAGKLRLLVADFRSNRPLLLALMGETDTDIRLTLGGPPALKKPGELGPGDEVTLRQYLGLNACGTRLQDGRFVMLTKIELIRTWAEQTGSSHEDWSMEPGLRSAIGAQVQINGLQATAQELRVTTNAVLEVADRLIGALKDKGIIDS